ncbi:malto-oligosyltrehalose synthase [Rhodobacteraceae bacterium HSP-20]|uniref:Malto-oligosyltrehalose synthase n=1 Tax=Paragemmobacter amnigenus TaxID=2852097 RepID=A0ABS6J334_9RHOB|nr:malto-oligosyltrehalose synthase [Rhodobacter amnigenus]MBU9698180.1 malto-oligosyltrehalose synthase [Rhodobacter amnigenus]MBV4389407.1 malto-oligosyltrehalose synthase [Rhodobacter amnigenus]
MIPTATYRIQLRNGVTLDDVARQIPRLAALGISHLYLSPIQTATPGSTHGYDITDPTEIDPTLGGRPALDRLSQQAQAAGLGLILDIVPNHTAFHLSNPWLRDVLRHGPAARHARHFDIDWSAGRLILPVLPEPFETLLDRGDITAITTPDGPALCARDLAIPLSPDSDAGTATAQDLIALHDAQHWRLTHWLLERDGVTHRRFFNITGLIGMRVEDPGVFDDTHALILDLVRSGTIHGLRIDHIDGLADPAAYLARLRAAVGDLPLWVEKILTRDEALPDWPVQGTTGYEATRQITRLLAAPHGLAKLRSTWEADTATPFATLHAAARLDILRYELAAEFLSLIDLARPIRDGDPALETGDESLREAIRTLLLAFPCYRSYLDDGPPSATDLRLIQSTADTAARTLRDDRTLRRLTQALTLPASPAETAFRTRFQQITGALAAKSLEDTAMFRYTPMLALCEVGSDPDEDPIAPADFAAWATGRGATWPLSLTLTSSHDTKRAEDARARLLAATHDPDALLALLSLLPPAFDTIPAAIRWYVAQSWLAIAATPERPDHPALPERLASHIEKALREAKEITTPTHPDPGAEAPILAAARALATAWRIPPAPAKRLIRLGEDLSLCQLALKLALPGIPDIYQGCETASYHLTDPDNRLPVDFEALTRPQPKSSLSAAKLDLTRTLLAFRRRIAADAPITGPVTAHAAPQGTLLSTRTPKGTIWLHLAPGATASAGKGPPLWPPNPGHGPVCLRFQED